MRSLLLATVVVSVAGAAAASVYQPSLAGPALDPTLSFHGGPGFTHAVSGGALSLLKAGGPGGEGEIYTTFSTAGDFDAKVTIDRSHLGPVGFDFAAYDDTAVLPLSTETSPGFNIFSNGPGDIRSYNVAGQAVDVGDGNATAVFELRRSGNVYESLLDGAVINSATYSAVNPFTFLLSLCSGSCISSPAPADQYGVVSDYSITYTPAAAGTPEPSSWAMLLLGFGGIGALVRRKAAVTATA